MYGELEQAYMTVKKRIKAIRHDIDSRQIYRNEIERTKKFRYMMYNLDKIEDEADELLDNSDKDGVYEMYSLLDRIEELGF